MINLYWPVYKNLEKEVIELSFNIYFDDNQFEYIKDKEKGLLKSPPYSLKIGELLIRCCTEIEALIKELTSGKDTLIKRLPNVDSNKAITNGCRLKYLFKTYCIDEKIVVVSSNNMYFKNAENKSFTPFKYQKNSFDDYYSAYNAVKHNRNLETLHKGNIRYLLKALASLYILNLYYRNDIINLDRNPNYVPSFSDIFMIESLKASMTEKNGKVKITYSNFNALKRSVFLVKKGTSFTKKEYQIIDSFNSEVNKKIAEIKLLNPNIEHIKAIELAIQLSQSGQQLKESSENIEYEAIIVNPKDIDFYISIGCKEKFNDEELKIIETEIENLKLEH
ncbi:hypothetical protein [Flavobacterium sp. JP2137]|uniref:hypothetical protein n=1 Tax=Flavobacterium sp. JP2137 TaxID=3414510 RepID=UPI003D2FAFD5